MIAIVNVSKQPKEKGLQTYEVRINYEVIAKFTHRREQGLAICLLKAAIAIMKKEQSN